MKETVYITGHRVPDTDSICSALAYADLKNRVGDVHAIPIRIGEINPETRFVLDYFQVDAPRYMDSMAPQLSELDYDRAHGISEETTLRKATELIEENHLNSLAVVNEANQLSGIISLSNITKSYANVWDDTVIGRSHTPLRNILEVLSASVLVEPKQPRPFTGAFNIYAMEEFNEDLIHENDLVMIGDRPRAQKDCIEHGVSLLILTNHSRLEEDLVPLAEEAGVTVIRTGLTTFMAACLLRQAVPVRFVMAKSNLVAFHQDDSLEDARQIMAKTRFRSYPILDNQDQVIGSISRYHLINTARKKLILVDHNERTQSIADLELAEIVEIIDHHRVANITTQQPIYFRNMPVGCTSTIVAQMYFEQGIRPSRAMAGLMCSAIISDTLYFRSPTATAADRFALERLAPIAGINPEEYAMEMFRAGTDLSTKKPSEILTQDVKFFNIEGLKVRVAQVFSMNADPLRALKERLLTRMEELLREQEEDLYILVMTDIFKESSTVLVKGDYAEAVAKAFDASMQDHEFNAPGLLSRKKQLIPRISAVIAREKAE